MSLPPELLKKVKLLEIRTRKIVNTVFSGEYHAAFKGQGMTFAEFREYVHGDDVRNISWTLTARAGKPFIKKYDEERELVMLLAVDISGSGNFGSGEYFKGEAMIHLAAILGFSAINNNDQVGLILFSNEVEHFVPPKKGRAHVHRLLRDILYFQPKNKGTKIQSAVEQILSFQKRKASVFMFSDFQDKGYEKSLRQLGKKHDVVAIRVTDPLEWQLPRLGLLDLEDPETGDIVTIDTSDPVVRKQFELQSKKDWEEQTKILRKSQVDLVDVDTSQDIVTPLARYFQGRHRR
jgi:uncharacterized protein (DUF58 family)